MLLKRLSPSDSAAIARTKSIDNQPISIELREHHYLLEHGLLEANVGATDYDINEPTMGIGGGS